MEACVKGPSSNRTLIDGHVPGLALSEKEAATLNWQGLMTLAGAVEIWRL